MKYDVVIEVLASIIVTVEADSKEEAAERAYEEAGGCPSMCHHCARKIDLSDLGDILEVTPCPDWP